MVDWGLDHDADRAARVWLFAVGVADIDEGDDLGAEGESEVGLLMPSSFPTSYAIRNS